VNKSGEIDSKVNILVCGMSISIQVRHTYFDKTMLSVMKF